jgi:hypothetical protein
MSLEERIMSLKAKHHSIESRIEVEATKPHPDDLEIATLKKQKLRIKDQLASLGG